MRSDITEFAGDLLNSWNDREITRLLKFYDEDYVGQDVGRASPILGHQGIKRAFGSILTAFPDFHMTNLEWVAHGNQLAFAWNLKGTQLGAVMNVPPTGRRISVQGSSFYTLEKRKIVRGIHIWDVAGLLRCLRLLPDL